MAERDDPNPEEVEPEAPGPGENPCRWCGGSGRFDGSACPECDGTGVVTTGIGGG